MEVEGEVWLVALPCREPRVLCRIGTQVDGFVCVVVVSAPTVFIVMMVLMFVMLVFVMLVSVMLMSATASCAMLVFMVVLMRMFVVVFATIIST